MRKAARTTHEVTRTGMRLEENPLRHKSSRGSQCEVIKPDEKESLKYINGNYTGIKGRKEKCNMESDL